MDTRLFSSLAIGLLFGIAGIWAGRNSSAGRVTLIRWGLVCGLSYATLAWVACLVNGNSLAQEFAARRSLSSFALSITTAALVLWLFHLIVGANDD